MILVSVLPLILKLSHFTIINAYHINIDCGIYLTVPVTGPLNISCSLLRVQY